jgi:hypothetical protein
VAGTDDLFRPGVEDGRVEKEWLSLRATEPAVVTDELLEGGHLAGDGIDDADHQDVRHVRELGLAPEVPRCVRVVWRQRSPVLGVDEHEADARVLGQPRDESGSPADERTSSSVTHYLPPATPIAPSPSEGRPNEGSYDWPTWGADQPGSRSTVSMVTSRLPRDWDAAGGAALATGRGSAGGIVRTPEVQASGRGGARSDRGTPSFIFWNAGAVEIVPPDMLLS